MTNDLQLHMVSAHQASLQRAVKNAHREAALAPPRNHTVLFRTVRDERLITRVLSWRSATEAPKR